MKRDIDVPRVALVVFVVVVGGVFVAGGATSTGIAFDAFNPDWEGTSELRSVAEAEGSEPVFIENTSRYDEYGANTTAFIIAPEEAYTERDIARILTFLDRGGTLVVADRDGPHGATLLRELGADAQPVGPVLRDERHQYRNPALPIATEIGDHAYVEGVDEITLNYGTAVEPNDATILASSSPYAYLDRDGSGSLSENESLASYPVVTVESVGGGAVVTVGDPSVFINVMQKQDGNRAFSSALVADTDHVLIDISRTGSPPPLVAALLLIRGSIILQVFVALGGLALLSIASRYARARPSFFQRKPL